MVAVLALRLATTGILVQPATRSLAMDLQGFTLHHMLDESLIFLYVRMGHAATLMAMTKNVMRPLFASMLLSMLMMRVGHNYLLFLL
jgi:hypothetical protein